MLDKINVSSSPCGIDENGSLVEYKQDNETFVYDEKAKDTALKYRKNFDPEDKWCDQDSEIKPNHDVTVFDVAAYILKKLGLMTTMKLQKLVYYCQAWSLVWDEKPLFKEPIEAWANGPVVRELYNYHRGQFNISSVMIGNPDVLDPEQKETIDAVLDYYGNKPSQWLIDLTHMEDPWKKARAGMSEKDRGNKVIGLDTIAEYYSSL